MKTATFKLAVIAVLMSAGAALAGPGAGGHSHGDETAYGKPGDPKKPARTVQVVMSERDGKMAFIPDRVEVRRGEQALPTPQQWRTRSRTGPGDAGGEPQARRRDAEESRHGA